MAAIDHRRAARWLVVAFLASAAIFSLWPGIDIDVSAYFFTAGEGFTLAANPTLAWLREFVWGLSIAVVLISLLALALGAFGRPVPGFGLRPAGFVFTLYLLGPVMLVNGVLKRYWGRARPADIAEFGGAHDFTPALLPADQCAANCSFVSGEGSAAVALAISLLVLAVSLRKILPRALYLPYVVMSLGLSLSGIGLRVMTGRHFLSDTVFAALLVLAIALALHRLILADRHG